MPDQPSHEPRPDQPQPSSAASEQPGPHAPQSVEVLQQILARLQRMEGGLSQHEEWLRRIEQDAHQAPDQPQTVIPLSGSETDEERTRLIGALTLERDRTQKALAEAQRQLGQYQQEMVALRKLTAESKQQLAQREQELATLKQNSQKELQKSSATQTDLARQLEHRNEHVKSLQTRVATAEQQIAAREKQIAQMRSALDKAAQKFETLSRAQQQQRTKSAESVESTTWSRTARMTVAVIAAAAFVSVVLCTSIYQHARNSTACTLSAVVTAPGVDGPTLEKLAASAQQQNKTVTVAPDAKRGVIELRLECTDAKTGRDQLDRTARALLSSLPHFVDVAASQPASQPAGRELLARISEVNHQLAPAAAPADPAVNTAELAAQYAALQSEKHRVAESITQLSDKLDPKAVAADSATVTTEQIAKTQAGDAQLQTELEALKQREDQLAERLHVSVEAAQGQIKTMRDALTTADTWLQKTLQESHPEEVTTQLNAVREAVKTWDRALTELGTQWQAGQGPGATSRPADALAWQATLEKASRGFIRQLIQATTGYNGAVQAIGQGQDQTTKRLVLRNELVKQLTPVTSAQESVLNTAQSVILSENVELTAIAQRLDALRKQTDQRRAQIVTALRQDRLAHAQQDQAARTAHARQEYGRLTARMAELDAALAKLAQDAVQGAVSLQSAMQSTRDRSAAQDAQLRNLQQLLGMHEAFAEQVRTMPALPQPTCLPTRVLAASTGGPAASTMLLAGLLPLILAAVGLLIARAVASTRRSRETLEEYTRSLKKLARNAETAGRH